MAITPTSSGHDGWMYQGRQSHGWFGHGTGPGTAAPSGPAQSDAVVQQRIRDIGHTLVAGLPAAKRHHDAARLNADDRARLTRLLTGVVQTLPSALPAVARRVFGVHPDKPGLDGFVQAAGLLRQGRTNADLRAATDALGKAVQDIGLDHFKRFLRDSDRHLAEQGGLATLVRDLPVIAPGGGGGAVRIPLPPILGRMPWASLPAIGALDRLPATPELIQREDVKATLARFDLDATKPADVVAAYAFLWAENLGPWMFNTPQTGPVMEAMAGRVMRAARADPDLFGRAMAGEDAAQRQFTAAVTGPQSGSGIETRSDDERDLVAQLARQGKDVAAIQAELDAWRRRGGRLNAEQRRNTPGVVVASTPLPHVDGPWLSAHMAGDEGAAIPGQIAEKLVGRRFASFGDLREAFWTLVAQDPMLAHQFSELNREIMLAGHAPYPPQSEQVVIRRTGEVSSRPFELHHDPAIGFGGPVYDLSTIRVVTPRQHDTTQQKAIDR